jgi:hypothetical protein
MQFPVFMELTLKETENKEDKNISYVVSLRMASFPFIHLFHKYTLCLLVRH